MTYQFAFAEFRAAIETWCVAWFEAIRRPRAVGGRCVDEQKENDCAAIYSTAPHEYKTHIYYIGQQQFTFVLSYCVS